MITSCPNAKVWARTRQQVLTRDNTRCRMCGSARTLEIHHMVPRVKGGSNLPDNLITLCSMCHKKAEKLNRPQVVGVELTCPRIACGRSWLYTGSSTTRTSCPVCKTSVTIAKNEVGGKKK
jgi:hypothetical protein